MGLSSLRSQRSIVKTKGGESVLAASRKKCEANRPTAYSTEGSGS